MHLRNKTSVVLTNRTLVHAGNFKFVALSSLAAAPLNFDPGDGAIISTKLISGQTAFVGVINNRFSFIAWFDNRFFTTEYFFGPGFHLSL